MGEPTAPQVLDDDQSPRTDKPLLAYAKRVLLVSYCPECGGELKFDLASKNFICKSCGLFASREKMDEIRDKAEEKGTDKRRQMHDEYIDWWQSSKKDKQKS